MTEKKEQLIKFSTALGILFGSLVFFIIIRAFNVYPEVGNLELFGYSTTIMVLARVVSSFIIYILYS